MAHHLDESIKVRAKNLMALKAERERERELFANNMKMKQIL